MIKKTLLAILFVLVCVVSSRATTVSGTMTNGASVGQTGVLYFQVSQQTSQLSSGGCGGPAVIVPTVAVSIKVTAGVVTPTTIVGNDCMAPSDTYYIVIFKDAQNNILFNQNWEILGSSIDVGAILPIIVPTGTYSIGQAFITNLTVTGSCIGCGGGGGGGGSIGGSILANQVAVGSGINTIGGDPLFLWNSTTHSQFNGPFMSVIDPPTSLAYFFGLIPASQVNKWQKSTDASGDIIGIGNITETDQDSNGWSQYNVLLCADSKIRNCTGTQQDILINTPATFSTTASQDAFFATSNTIGAGNNRDVSGVAAESNNFGTGTVTLMDSFEAVLPTNTGGGTIHKTVGFYAYPWSGVGDTLNAAFMADTVTPGTNNYAFYNASGLSLLNNLTVTGTCTGCTGSGTFGGSIAANQVAVGSGTNTLGGSSAFTFVTGGPTSNVLTIGGSPNFISSNSTSGAIGLYGGTGGNGNVQLVPGGTSNGFSVTNISGVLSANLFGVATGGGGINYSLGTMTFLGNGTSGSASIGSAAIAGTPAKICLPTTTAASTGYLLQSDGGTSPCQQTSWVAPGGGTIGGSIATNQVAVGSGTNTIGGDPNFTWQTANKLLSIGDSFSGLSASTLFRVTGQPYNLQSITHSLSASPKFVSVVGVAESGGAVDSATNHIGGGYFVANATSTLYSGSGRGPLTGVEAMGIASHTTGYAGQILGGLFTGESNGAGSVGDLAGLASQASVGGSGLVDSANAIHIYDLVVTGGTPPTQGVGLAINPITGGVHNWQILLGNQIQDANHWAIQTGTGKVEFGDNVIVHSTILLDGLTSGIASIGSAAIAGTPAKICLPTTTAASTGYLLQSDGGTSPCQQTSWVAPVITATSSAFATATTAGTCVQSTTAVTGALTSMVANVSPVSTPGVGAQWSAFVSSSGNVTINECAVAASAGGTIAFNIRVTQ